MTNFKCSILGLCGAARSGKDTFFEFAEKISKEEGVTLQRLAFADVLKEELDDFLLTRFGISAFTDSSEEKSIIRPIMVAYGEAKRNLSKGTYWIDRVTPKAEQNKKDGIVSVVTDVRYLNELKWLKSMGGNEGRSIYIEREGILPANEEEEKNDPDLREHSDIKVKWKTFKDKNMNLCRPIVEEALSNLCHEE